MFAKWLLAILAAGIVAAPAAAAGFDCSKAREADEIAICRTPALSARDSEMTGLWYAWSRVPMAMGSNGARHDDAQTFLRRRKTCGRDIDCLARAYDDRIAALRSGIDDAMREMFHLQNGGG